jgi:hypothetical protein
VQVAVIYGVGAPVVELGRKREAECLRGVQRSWSIIWQKHRRRFFNTKLAGFGTFWFSKTLSFVGKVRFMADKSA